jgi:hypothetical protein
MSGNWNPVIDSGRASLCSRSRCWVDCIMNIRRRRALPEHGKSDKFDATRIIAEDNYFRRSSLSACAVCNKRLMVGDGLRRSGLAIRTYSIPAVLAPMNLMLQLPSTDLARTTSGAPMRCLDSGWRDGVRACGADDRCRAEADRDLVRAGRTDRRETVMHFGLVARATRAHTIVAGGYSGNPREEICPT